MKFITLLLCLFALPVFAVGQQLPKFQVSAKQIHGKTVAQKEKMRRALAIFEEVMNDECFQKELLGSRFQSDTHNDPYKTWSTQQVIKTIYEAAEKQDDSAPNYIADINWIVKERGFLRTITDRDCSTIGFFDHKKENAIITYTCFFDDAGKELSVIVGHVAHEWTHALGFVHQFDYHSERDKTVPYTFGYIVSKYAEKYIQ